MFERMLEKNKIPDDTEIIRHIGKKSYEYIDKIKSNLQSHYNIHTELKFPFGDNYGWGYKFSNKTKHLFYVFFEKNAITVTLQFKKISSDFEKTKYEALTTEGKNYWENRYPCGDGGGWIHYRITTNDHLADIGKLIMIKLKKEIEWKV